MRKIWRVIKCNSIILIGLILLSFNKIALADTPSSGDDPFPNLDVQGGDVVQAVGQYMETGMKYAMIGGGIIMMLVGIGVIMHRLREDSSNKETGSFLTTLIISGVAITVGIILIAIGWSAADYKPS